MRRLAWLLVFAPLAACPDYGFPESPSDAGTEHDAGSDTGFVEPDADANATTRPRGRGIALAGESSFGGATCVIRSGKLQCWGDNSRGQLARPELAGANTPTPGAVTGAEGFSGVTAVSGHEAMFCALATGGAYCWGQGPTGGSTGPANYPLQLQGIESISAGGSVACARKGPDAYCWGNNDRAQLTADFDAGTASVPTKIAGVGSIKDIAVGFDHGCAIRLDGNIVCWGRNDARQSGPPTGDTCGATPCIKRPTLLAGVVNAQSLALGEWHSCAIDGAKRVFCWGADDHGQLGTRLGVQECIDGGVHYECSGVPLRVAAMDGADQVVAAGGSTCVLKSGGVYCFGRNNDQQWGRNLNTADGEVPQQVLVNATTSLEGVREIALRRYYACALTDSDEVYCWGTANTGGLGTSGTVNRYATRVTFP